MSDTEWTEEKRAERCRMRDELRSEIRGYTGAKTEEIVNRVLPEPPPLLTYGRELHDKPSNLTYRRRSDGQWQARCYDWEPSVRTDASVREFAAEVPLTDAECDALMLGNWGGPEERRAFIRAAFARVLRGEVRGE